MEVLEVLDEQDMERDFVSVTEAAAILPISASGLYQQIKKKQIPAVRFGPRIFLRKSVLNTLKDAGTGPFEQLPVRAGKD